MEKYRTAPDEWFNISAYIAGEKSVELPKQLRLPTNPFQEWLSFAWRRNFDIPERELLFPYGARVNRRAN
jgi:hypothetical protein